MVLHRPIECTRVTGKVRCTQINLGGFRVYQKLGDQFSVAVRFLALKVQSLAAIFLVSWKHLVVDPVLPTRE